MKRAPLVIFALACACGGAKPSPAATIAPIPSASAIPAAPRDPIATMWPIAEPEFLLRVDVAGARATALGSAVLPVAVSALLDGELGKNIPPAQARCIRDAVGAANEIVAGANREGSLWIVRWDPARLASPAACLDGWHTADVAGAREAWRDGDTFAAIASPGLLVSGTRALVEAAVRGDARDAHALDAVALRSHEYARGTFSSRGAHADASLVLTDALFALRVNGNVSEQLARNLASSFDADRARLQAELEKASPGVDGAALAHLMSAASLTRDGGVLHFAFELREPVKDQARDLGLAAALAVAGVQKYLLDSKEAEARSNLHAIARELAVWWEEEQPPPKPRHRTRLVSFPPVPKDVPRGTTYASTPDDWKPWSALRFEIDSPQRYQYEIRAARDGKAADIVAHGDLNGDGKPSTFALHVRIDPKTHQLVFDPKPTEVDPDE